MKTKLIRIGIAVIVCGHVRFAGPFGLKEMTEDRVIATYLICLLALCVLWTIEFVLIKLGMTHQPDRGEKFLAKRVLTFMIASVISCTTVITIFLHFYDHESGINHLSFDSMFEVFISLVVATIIFGGFMWFLDQKDIGKYNLEQKLSAENDRERAENEKLRAENDRVLTKNKMEREKYEKLMNENIELKEAEGKALDEIVQLKSQKLDLKTELLSLYEENRKIEIQMQELEQQNSQQKDIIQAFERTKIHKYDYDNYVVVPIKQTNGQTLQLDTRDFVFSETLANYTIIWYIKGGILEKTDDIRITSSHLEVLLQGDKNISRCNRKYLLNIRYIEHINKDFVRVKGTEKKISLAIRYFGGIDDKIKVINDQEIEQ